MKTALAAAALLAAAPAAPALQQNVGTTAAQFLTIGAGARSLGMGGAYTAIATGPEAIYWNPAGLAGGSAPEATYSLTQLPASITHDYAAVSAPVPWLSGELGFAFTELAQPSLDLVTASNQNVGSFSPHSEAYSVAYAHRFTLDGSAGAHALVEALDAGLAVKYVNENLGTRSASTFAIDAGATMRPSFLQGLVLGAAVRNLGGKLNFIAEAEPLPTEIGASAAYIIRGEGWRVLPALDVSLPDAGNPYVKLGVEVSHAIGERMSASARLGYTTQPAVDLGFVSGLTAGVGLHVNKFFFDAAFEPMTSLGDEYRLSVGWRF